MAINVQAAPFVNRMLHKQNVSYSGCLNVLQLRMATIRNDQQKKKPHTKNIHALYTNASPETTKHRFTTLPSSFFFPLPLYDLELIHDVMMETHGA